MSHQIQTPASLIRKIKEERRSLNSSLIEGRGYNGPDPNAANTATTEARIKAMDDVLKWIQECEIGAASLAVNDALKKLT